MVAILILNWNGWQDTIECLSSLFKIDYDDYFVVLGDNGSTNESKNKILSYCQTIDSSVQWITNSPERFVGRQSRKKEIFLLDLEKNHGFAKGNNYLSAFAMTFSPNYYLLLNNDTEVESDFLTKLVEYQISPKEFHVLTPLIHYFYDKQIVLYLLKPLIDKVIKYIPKTATYILIALFIIDNIIIETKPYTISFKSMNKYI